MRVRCECFVFRLTPLQRADFSSRGGLPSVHYCMWQGKTANLYTRNDQAGRGQTKTKFILHFHSYTLSTNCCLIKRKGKMISVPSLFSESSYHTLCSLNRRHRKKMRKATIMSSSCLFVCFLMEHLGSHWTNFH